MLTYVTEATASENRLSPRTGCGWHAGYREAKKTGDGETWVSLDKQAGQGTVRGSFVWRVSVASRLQTLTSCLWFGLGDLGQGKYVLNM